MPTLKVSAYIATSLDGFIARKDGDIQWLNKASSVVPEGEDCGFKAFMDSVDVMIMGRNTYDQVRTFNPWPYGKKQVIVLTRSELQIPDHLSDTVTYTDEEPLELFKRLSSEGARHLYVDGGITIRRFLKAGLIHEITLTQIPILLGEGKPLFGPLERDIHLAHLTTKAYDFGFVQTKYKVIEAASSTPVPYH